ncbi:hypothetical protein PanWU01x14_037210 [Parasponia andersonii]|uniref:Transmembrane protein n=1 Tax=Parasponia andersonii TaxID=3476 RepID=A0A2P5DSN0_PARAD|nr:hypothetical protein PanWU01x14_037210 [Parasponia andersonii]
MCSGADSLGQNLVLAANRLQPDPPSPDHGSRSQRLLSGFFFPFVILFSIYLLGFTFLSFFFFLKLCNSFDIYIYIYIYIYI